MKRGKNIYACGRGVKSSSRGHSLSDGGQKVGCGSERQLTGRRDKVEVEEEVEKWSASFLLVAWVK